MKKLLILLLLLPCLVMAGKWKDRSQNAEHYTCDTSSSASYCQKTTKYNYRYSRDFVIQSLDKDNSQKKFRLSCKSNNGNDYYIYNSSVKYNSSEYINRTKCTRTHKHHNTAYFTCDKTDPTSTFSIQFKCQPHYDGNPHPLT